MKAKYINPFLAASLNLFKDYLEVNCSHQPPFLNTEPQNLKEVSGIIGLAGETVGAVVLSFDRQTAINMAEKFAGKKFVGLTNDVIDAVGELVNIIAGNAKKDLVDFRIVISLPGVVTGTDAKIKWPSGIPVITIPFTSDMGEWSVNVSFRE